MKRISLILLLILVLAVFAASGSAEEQSLIISAGLKAPSIAKGLISKANVYFVDLDSKMYKGSKCAINVVNSFDDNLTCKIATSNKSIVGLTRDADGKIYAVAKKKGNAVITAKIVYRKKAYKVSQRIYVKNLTITGILMDSSVALNRAEIYELNPVTVPVEVDKSLLTWTSSDVAVARVSTSGVVTAVAPGNAIIKAKRGTTSAECLVTVKPDMPVTGTRRAHLFGMSLGDEQYVDFYFSALTSVADELRSVTGLFNSIGVNADYSLNYTKSKLLSTMNTWKNGVKSNDMTYIYYSGHGAVENGQLYMIAGVDRAVTVRELKEKLDSIPGKIVLMLNCCESGDAIGKSIYGSDFAQAFVNEFKSIPSKSGEFLQDKYTVICACKSTQYGWIINDVDVYADAFTKALGWDLINMYPIGMRNGDANGDGYITLTELSTFMRKTVNNTLARKGKTQTVVCYPQTSDLVLF